MCAVPVEERNSNFINATRAAARPCLRPVQASPTSPCLTAPSRIACLALAGGADAPRHAAGHELPVVQPNANTKRAGVLRDGVLTVALEAKESTWHR